MNPKAEWGQIKNLSDQIRAQILINSSGHVTNDKQPYTYMYDDCKLLFQVIDNFVGRYKHIAELTVLSEWEPSNFSDSMIELKCMVEGSRPPSDQGNMNKNCFMYMFHFMRKFEFSNSVDEIDLSAITEVAFNHLQRLLVADNNVSALWKAANGNEPKFEKLGSAHMMMHGIYAFKAGATKQETDLIYRDTSFRDDVDYNIFRGMVLTEWKSCWNQSPIAASRKAIDQAKDYASGTLLGMELRRVRYIVLVSDKKIKIPDDVICGDVLFKHVNIAIDPLTSSKSAGTSPRKRSA